MKKIILFMLLIPLTSNALCTLDVLDKVSRETKKYYLQDDVEFKVPLNLKGVNCVSPPEEKKYMDDGFTYTRQLFCYYGNFFVWTSAMKIYKFNVSLSEGISVGLGNKEYYISIRYE